MRWAPILYDGSPYEREIGTHTQREDQTRTWGEGDHLPAQERGLRRDQVCQQHLDLKLPASRGVKEYISVV